MYDREMQRELRGFRQICLILSEDMTWSQLSERAGLAPATVRRFFAGTTKSPAFRTVFAIGRACGLTVTLENNTLRMANVA